MEKTYSLDSLLEEFSLYLVEKKRKEECTTHFYKADLKIILSNQIYKNYGELVSIIDKRINSSDKWDKSKQSTKNRRIVSANTFLKFLEKTGRIEKAPKYKTKKVEREYLKITTSEKFTKLMEATPYDNYRDARDRAIFSLMFYTGLRESEVVKLEDKNFKLEDKLYVSIDFGESYKRRKLEIPEQAVKEINNYRKLYSVTAKNKAFPSLVEGSFFKNKFGKKISTRSVSRKFEKLAKIVGIKDNLKSLRYSYAKMQFDKGTKPEEFAKLLGIERDRRNIDGLKKFLP